MVSHIGFQLSVRSEHVAGIMVFFANSPHTSISIKIPNLLRFPQGYHCFCFWGLFFWKKLNTLSKNEFRIFSPQLSLSSSTSTFDITIPDLPFLPRPYQSVEVICQISQYSFKILGLVSTPLTYHYSTTLHSWQTSLTDHCTFPLTKARLKAVTALALECLFYIEDIVLSILHALFLTETLGKYTIGVFCVSGFCFCFFIVQGRKLRLRCKEKYLAPPFLQSSSLSLWPPSDGI